MAASIGIDFGKVRRRLMEMSARNLDAKAAGLAIKLKNEELRLPSDPKDSHETVSFTAPSAEHERELGEIMWAAPTSTADGLQQKAAEADLEGDKSWVPESTDPNSVGTIAAATEPSIEWLLADHPQVQPRHRELGSMLPRDTDNLLQGSTNFSSQPLAYDWETGLLFGQGLANQPSWQNI